VNLGGTEMAIVTSWGNAEGSMSHHH
jgi:hypothetical protein